MHVRVAVTARVADDDGLGPVDVFEILGEAKQDGLHSTFGLQAVLFGACHVGASGVERELRCKEQEHAAHGGVAELRDGRRPKNLRRSAPAVMRSVIQAMLKHST